MVAGKKKLKAREAAERRQRHREGNSKTNTQHSQAISSSEIVEAPSTVKSAKQDAIPTEVVRVPAPEPSVKAPLSIVRASQPCPPICSDFQPLSTPNEHGGKSEHQIGVPLRGAGLSLHTSEYKRKFKERRGMTEEQHRKKIQEEPNAEINSATWILLGVGLFFLVCFGTASRHSIAGEIRRIAIASIIEWKGLISDKVVSKLKSYWVSINVIANGEGLYRGKD